MRSRDYVLEETTELTMLTSFFNVSGNLCGLDDEMDLVLTNATDTGMYRVKVKFHGNTPTVKRPFFASVR